MTYPLMKIMIGLLKTTNILFQDLVYRLEHDIQQLVSQDLHGKLLLLWGSILSQTKRSYQKHTQKFLNLVLELD